MSEEKKHMVKPAPMDYAQLRAYGLEYLKSMSSAYWTDFSIHDPGVTILEALSLALADLAYRSSASMSDLLTRKGNSAVSLEGTLFPPQEILSQAPTTIADYRKLVLECIPHVRNVWFRPGTRNVDVRNGNGDKTIRSVNVQGYYNVCLELDSKEEIENDWDSIRRLMKSYGIDAGSPKITDFKSLYRGFVRKFLLKHRNLCEDILDVTVLEPVYIGLSLDIQLETEADVGYIIQQIYDRVSSYVSPDIHHYSLDEMLAKGRTLDQIYGLHVPVSGFVDKDELEEFSQTRELYISDVIAMVMQIKGVKSIQHARFIVKEGESKYFNGFPAGNHISLKENASVSFSLSPYFVRRDLPRGKELINIATFNRGHFSFFPSANDDGGSMIRLPIMADVPENIRLIPEVPAGEYRDTDRYFSFQNLLPPAYKVGVDPLPDNASNLRKAQRLQLKAYLTFFDKILSDYLAQIDSFLDLLSVEPAAKGTVDKTYFHHFLTDGDIVDVSKVIKDWPDYKEESENDQDALNRKNQILNHLMSRFCDSFAEYAVLEFVREKAAEEFTLRERVEDKKRMLKDYASISSLRSAGLDYSNTWTVSGMERRILRKLGVNDEDMEWPCAGKDKLNLHLIEHNLLVNRQPGQQFLRLSKDDDLSVLVADPYSFRVTVAVTGWPDVCLIRTYREHVERIIREEIPAHVLVKICWVSRNAMFDLEEAINHYNDVMKEEKYPPKNNSGWLSDHLKAVTCLGNAVSSLANIYERIVIYPDNLDEGSADSALRLDFAGLDESWKDDDKPFHGAKPKPEPSPFIEPEPEPEPGPPADADPEPVIPAEPEPGPENPAVPEPGPETPAEPEPEPSQQKLRVVALSSVDSVAAACRKAGAKHAGLSSLVKKIAKGWTDFDVVICEEESKDNLPKMEAVLKPLGILPSYENGTIVLRSKMVAKVKEIIGASKPVEPASGQDSVLTPGQGTESTPIHELGAEQKKVIGSLIDGLSSVSTRKLSDLISAVESKKKQQE